MLLDYNCCLNLEIALSVFLNSLPSLPDYIFLVNEPLLCMQTVYL